MTYRAVQLSCPDCAAVLDERQAVGRMFSGCASCHGLFVEEAVVRDMFHQMDPTYEVVLRGGHGSPLRKCPACREPMVPVALASVPVDHCPPHGIWFDREELELALRRERELAITTPTSGSRLKGAGGALRVLGRIVLELLSLLH